MLLKPLSLLRIDYSVGFIFPVFLSVFNIVVLHHFSWCRRGAERYGQHCRRGCKGRSAGSCSCRE